MNSSELAPQEIRTVITYGNITDINSNSKNRTISSNITVSAVVLRGYKDLTVDPANPQNITATIVATALGGTVGNIIISDYLPEGATVYSFEVWWDNGTYIPLNETEDYQKTAENLTILGNYRATAYQYNFTETGLVWPGHLQNNQSLIINYSFWVLGGGSWELPAIISGYDPIYKREIKTEMYADANVPSFDVILEVLTKKVLPGETVKSLLRILNVGGPRAKVDVYSSYSIRSLEGELIDERSETIAVTEQKEKLLELKVPQDSEPGRYIFESYVEYTGRETLSTQTFEVMGEQKKGPLEKYGLYFVIGLLVLMNLAILARRK